VIAGLQDWLGRVGPGRGGRPAARAHLGAGAPEPVAPLAQSAAAAALDPTRVLRCAAAALLLRDAATGGSPCSPAAHALLPGEVRRAAALLAAGELKVGDLPGLDPADRLTWPAAGHRVDRHRADAAPMGGRGTQRDRR
jgi:hypothetical protein